MERVLLSKMGVLPAWACVAGLALAGCGASSRKVDRTDGGADAGTDAGAACSDGESRPCYPGPEVTLDVGECRAGSEVCDSGAWSECEGHIVPADEECNGLDDDCDGETDEGVLSECGACGPCERTCWGPSEECDDWGKLLDSRLARTPEGWLVLDGYGADLHVIWLSSMHRSDVLRVDTRTVTIEAAFWTGPDHGDPGDEPWGSAVDSLGNVVIANMGNPQSSLTKIAASVDSCPDSNGNGVIETSTGWDDKLPFDTHDDWADECILWHTTVGGGWGGWLAPVAVHQVAELDGVVERGWVGLGNEPLIVEFDVETGEPTGRELVVWPPKPSALAVDADGLVWTAHEHSAQVGRFDTARLEDGLEWFDLPDGDVVLPWHSVIIDENGAPWVSTRRGLTRNTGLHRWDPETESFVAIAFGYDEAHCGTGLGPLASDGRGSIWLAAASGPCVFRIRNAPGEADDLTVTQIETPDVWGSSGMALDFDGHAWIVDGQRAALVDVETEEARGILDDCDGAYCLSSSRVYGDPTGVNGRMARWPLAQWTAVASGCAGTATDWKRIFVRGSVPDGSDMSVSARTAPSSMELAGASFVDLGLAGDGDTEIPLDAAFEAAAVRDAELLEVRVALRTLDHWAVPTLLEVAVEWACTDHAR